MSGCTTAGANVLTLPFSQNPSLQQPGGSLLISASNYSDPTCGFDGIIVVQTSAGMYVALQSACTHACCPVCFDGTQLHCACHGANYDVTTGKCTNGVATVPLQMLPTCSDAMAVYVTLPTS